MVVDRPTAARLLADWRAVERRRDALTPGSTEHQAAVAECDALARAYRMLLDTQRRERRQLAGFATDDQR
jgi:hypothetical protein